ncbi:MAG: acireductone synthase [Parvibaculum sp.]|nr:acireductone synthase [Parvibaculum sp.]
MTIRAIVTDIEGTTTPIAFVHEVLFPYARARLADFCAAHQSEPAVATVLAAVREEAGDASLTLDETVVVLFQWMDEDRKSGPLKTLQGMIWRLGYEEGVLKGQIYDDAAEVLSAWHVKGIVLYVYSSGSVAAQKLIFGFSDHGDLTRLFGGYFDTAIGAKVDVASYAAIAKSIGVAPADILFLTDMEAEVVAARAAGLTVAKIDRSLPQEKTRHDGDLLVAGSFGPVDRLIVQA